MATNFISASCPSCGGELQVPDHLTSVKCMYCGLPVILKKESATSNNPTIENFIELADHAAEAENHEEAHTYYTKVLELEPRNIHALIQRGIAAAWQSTLANIRIQETKSGLDKALKVISEEGSIEEYRDEIDVALVQIANISLAILNIAFQHFQKFGTNVIYGQMNTLELDKASEADWHTHVDAVLGTLIYAIDTAKSVSASDEAKLAIYRSFFSASYWALNTVALSHPDFMVQKAFSTFPQQVQGIVSNYIGNIIAEAQALDPTLKDPRQVAQENKSSCYVATVAFNDPSDRHVNILREFRFQVLSKFTLGQNFIKWYYRNGKRIAEHLDCHPVIKVATKWALMGFAMVIAVTLRKHAPNDAKGD